MGVICPLGEAFSLLCGAILFYILRFLQRTIGICSVFTYHSFFPSFYNYRDTGLAYSIYKITKAPVTPVLFCF